MDTKDPIIGVDIVGGEEAPELLFQGLVNCFKDLPPGVKKLVFFAPSELIKKFQKIKDEAPAMLCPIEFVETQDTITMADDPLSALRMKKNAATPLAMGQLAEGGIDAFVSIGNTGALMVGTKVLLKFLDKIKRPGLLALLPTALKPLAVLDVGANVNCTSEHLLQFAHMGIAFQKCFGIRNPKVGLLNIGAEKGKGRSEMVEAYRALQKLNESSDVFLGNIEGKEVFRGGVDVLVTDGFSGNIFLKTAEGMTSYILKRIHSTIPDTVPSPHLSSLAHDLDYAEYPGALICGVDGIVIKCHGYSNAKAIFSGIKGACNLVESNFINQLKHELKEVL